MKAMSKIPLFDLKINGNLNMPSS